MSTCVPKGSRSAKGAAAAEVEPRDVDLQPEVKWHDGAAGYVARLDLAGFRKEEFRVQVDGAGRVTVRGQRPAGTSASTASSSCRRRRCGPDRRPLRRRHAVPHRAEAPRGRRGGGGDGDDGGREGRGGDADGDGEGAGQVGSGERDRRRRRRVRARRRRLAQDLRHQEWLSLIYMHIVEYVMSSEIVGTNGSKRHHIFACLKYTPI